VFDELDARLAKEKAADRAAAITMFEALPSETLQDIIEQDKVNMIVARAPDMEGTVREKLLDRLLYEADQHWESANVHCDSCSRTFSRTFQLTCHIKNALR